MKESNTIELKMATDHELIMTLLCKVSLLEIQMKDLQKRVGSD